MGSPIVWAAIIAAIATALLVLHAIFEEIIEHAHEKHLEEEYNQVTEDHKLENVSAIFAVIGYSLHFAIEMVIFQIERRHWTHQVHTINHIYHELSKTSSTHDV